MLVIQFIIIVIVGIYISLHVLYNLSLILVHFLISRDSSLEFSPATKFIVLVPAHNEELLISALLLSIRAQNYPKNMYEAVVVADNCSDQTATIAEREGARTVERADGKCTGKGYAIKFGLENIKDEPYDAVLIVDADSIVKADTLTELDKAIQRGARIMQCYNGLANPNDSWFTRLMDVSRSLGNEVLGPAKEKIGLSAHLMGNGMCFVRDVIERYGWNAFTVGEDWEYYAKLVSKGERVAFVNSARVYHRESIDLKQATTQRLRWSSGRFAVAANQGIRLLCEGIKKSSLMRLDAAAPLLLPNPSLSVSLTVLLMAVVLVVPFPDHRGLFGWFLGWFGMLLVLQITFYLVGVMYVKEKKKKLLAIFCAPVFLAWKSVLDLLSIAGIGRKYWVRTERKL